MSIASASRLPSQLSTKPMPLTVEQAESLVLWLRLRIPTNRVTKPEQLKDPLALAFAAGQHDIINVIEIHAKTDDMHQ